MMIGGKLIERIEKIKFKFDVEVKIMDYEYFRRQLDEFLEERSIAELLETVMYAIKYKEGELIEAAKSNEEE